MSLCKSLLLSAIVIVSLFPTFQVEANSKNELSVEDKIYGLSLLWKEVSYNFVYFDQVENLDWDLTYKQALTDVIKSKNTYEYYRVLIRIVSLLDDGMTKVSMPLGLIEQYVDFPAIKLGEAQHQAVVIAVGDELKNKIPLGAIILEVDGKPIDEVLKKEVFPYISASTEHIRWHWAIQGRPKYGYGLLAGKPNSFVKLKIKRLDNGIDIIKVKRDLSQKNTSWYAAKPSEIESNFSLNWLENEIAHITINTFADLDVVEEFKNQIADLRKARGLIIDLRKNRGGTSLAARGILKHLTFYDLYGAKAKMRIHNSTYKAWGKYAHDYDWAKKYEPYFLGNAWKESESDILATDEVGEEDKIIVPTILLIGRETSGAAEDFLIYADTIKHFSTVGERTFGSTGQPLFVELPGGGSVKICTKRDTYPDGRDFVGYGIQPDVEVKRDINYYLSKTDLALDKAYNKLRDAMEQNQQLVNNELNK